MNPCRRRIVGGLVLGLAQLALAPVLVGCGKKAPRSTAVPRDAPVLALGDSITFGTGATADTSYPAELARLTGWAVVNAGVPGDTSAQALQRLPALLEEHSPRLVLVSIGGNDFLRRLPQAQTRANIRSICERVQAAGAQVLLIAVPELSLSAIVNHSLSDHELYEELSEELKLPLQSKGWSSVLGEASLRADAIHANAEGYKRFAHNVVSTALEVGLLAQP